MIKPFSNRASIFLKDGKQKELAEIDLRTKEEMNKLEQDKSKLKAAQGGIITADQTKDFQERQSNIQQKMPMTELP